MKPTLLLFLILLLPLSLAAQLRVQPNNNVHVNGIMLPSSEGVLSVRAEGKYTVSLRADNTPGDRVYGFNSEILRASSDPNENTTRAGVVNFVSGARHAYGMFNTVAPSDITSYGYGIRNQFDLYNVRSGSSQQGIYNDINFLITKHNLSLYGTRNDVNVGGASNYGYFYGSHNVVHGQVTARSYGVYSDVAAPGLAGYFKGDVNIDGELTVDELTVLNPSSAKSAGDAIELAGALEKVQGMRPLQLTRLRGRSTGANTANKNGRERVVYGFSAADLEAVDPNLVRLIQEPEVKVAGERPRPTEGEASDPPAEEETFVALSEGRRKSSINILQLIPILTQAIKEQ